jgi:hypothetical protein
VSPFQLLSLKSASFILEFVVGFNSLTTNKPHH